MVKVLVLGGSGMLGSMITDVLSSDPSVAVSATVRGEALLGEVRKRIPSVEWRVFDGAQAWASRDFDVLCGNEWIINCIGITKPLIRETNAADVERAIHINAALPHALAVRAARIDARVLQIATDCVYSGMKGGYREDDPHDALDVYGKTKSLGEVMSPNVYHLRCSIVGPEPKEFKFIFEWFRRQPPRTHLKGHTNHLWNGITTFHFARVGLGIIKAGLGLPPVQHVVPADSVTKDTLLREFSRWFDREDVELESIEAETAIDRTLSTNRSDLNSAIWQVAGYNRPPSISTMIRELSRHDYVMSALRLR